MTSPGLLDKPQYGLIAVNEELTLNYDIKDTWVAVKTMWAEECGCVMLGLSEIDPLIEKLQEVKVLLEKNLPDDRRPQSP